MNSPIQRHRRHPQHPRHLSHAVPPPRTGGRRPSGAVSLIAPDLIAHLLAIVDVSTQPPWPCPRSSPASSPERPPTNSALDLQGEVVTNVCNGGDSPAIDKPSIDGANCDNATTATPLAVQAEALAAWGSGRE
jgi:hypothetical protein